MPPSAEISVETPVTPYSVILTGHYLWTWSATWRSHGSTDWLIIHTVSGQGRFGHLAGEVSAEPGDVALLKPGTLHDYGKHSSAGVWEIVWAHFQPRPGWLEWMTWPEVAPGLMRLSIEEDRERRELLQELRQMHGWAAGTHRHREALAMNALERALLRCDEYNPLAEHSSMDPRILNAMSAITRDLKEPLSRENLAQECGLSVSRLSHLFREQTGFSLQQYQETQRLHRAKQLLEFSPLTIQAIADDVGYENPFYFSLRFKRQTGMSPRSYRQTHSRQSLSSVEP